MTEYFYRYRPIKAVLDEFHEMENQEIYFSTPDELNDPMEGFKDLFWGVATKSFGVISLKHYILCVLQTGLKLMNAHLVHISRHKGNAADLVF
jgi:hypothetical protein